MLELVVIVFLAGFYFGTRDKNKYKQKYFDLKNQHSNNAPTPTKNPDQYTPTPAPAIQKATVAAQVANQKSVALKQDQALQPQPNNTEQKAYIDNTSLLLYFGVFLFLVSIGLFVGFADVSGVLKTLSVVLVAVVLYSFGFWLHDNKAKLRQVGEAVVGMGMLTIPFIGITAYNFVFDQSNGVFVWGVTSLVALAMYIVTIQKLRSSFVSYMLVGSVVSLVLSFAGLVDGPLYTFIWASALVGIALQILSMYFKSIPSLTEASSVSGQLLLPLSLFASLASIGQSGVGQIAMTSFLASFYYALQAISSAENRREYAAASHILTLATVAFTTFSITDSFQLVGLSIIVVGLLQLAALYIFNNDLTRDGLQLAVIQSTPLIGTLLTIENPQLVTCGVGAIFLSGATLAHARKRSSGLNQALAAWIGLAFCFGQLLPDQGLSALEQSLLSIVFVAPFIGLLSKKVTLINNWTTTIRYWLMAGLSLSLAVALFSSPYSLLAVATGVSAVAIIAYMADRDKEWGQLALLFMATPLLYRIFTGNADSPYFLLTTVIFLLVCIASSLKWRLEYTRWLSVAAWLLLPIALLVDGIGVAEPTTEYALILYLCVVVALSCSRAIAMGKLFLSQKAPIASLYRSTSLAYYSGMWFASLLCLGLAFASTTGIAVYVLLLLTIILWIHDKYVEKSDIFTPYLPLALQVILFRAIEPYEIANQLRNGAVLYPLLSIILAGGYYAWSRLQDAELTKRSTLASVSIVTAFIAPLSFLWGEVTVIMPLSLIVAGILLLDYVWHSPLSERETAGGVILAGVLWLLWYLGITNIQIHAHFIAALFALYTYIRHQRGDESKSDSYLTLMLATATIPLAIQALGSSDDSSILGLWLLLEQIGFLVLGVTIKKPLVTKWGLYVGIAAVLYQLRDLGWAMLAVLSLFLIGVATYRALKQPDDK